ncbi:MAG: hypothetical protein JW929_00670, partial [Anaerolineales bacterium]|nr:hypothetical protein [Anaerolineales bacterium]
NLVADDGGLVWGGRITPESVAELTGICISASEILEDSRLTDPRNSPFRVNFSPSGMAFDLIRVRFILYLLGFGLIGYFHAGCW